MFSIISLENYLDLKAVFRIF